MKKSIVLFAAALALLTGCDNGKKEKEAQEALANQEALNKATREELQAAINERDELLSLVNEVASGMDEINNAEKIITVSTVGEGNSSVEIANNLAAIKNALAERRARISQLEKKIKDSKISNDKLLATIDNLKSQIETQAAQIETLTASLEAANQQISKLDTQVDSLNTRVNNVTQERNIAQEQAIEQANIANECYYAIGSKKELKEHNIIESGFLRKTKIMQGEFDKSYFTQADKRTLRSIPLHSNKAKVVSTNQPKNSYEIIDQNGSKVLRILNPTEFWGVSNYVVIQID